jgi:hypothetical protein
MTTALLIGWLVLTSILAWKCRRARTVYWSSCALAVIPIAVSQREFELLPMAGIVHVFVAGLYPLGFFALLNCCSAKRKPCNPPRKENL